MLSFNQFCKEHFGVSSKVFHEEITSRAAIKLAYVLYEQEKEKDGDSDES